MPPTHSSSRRDDPAVLLVVPSSEDVDRLRSAADREGVDATIHAVDRAADAIEALDRARGDAPGSESDAAPRLPTGTSAVILVDATGPDADGVDPLSTIRDEGDVHCPLIALVDDEAAADAVGRAYEQGANACVGKPRSQAEADELVRSLADFWIGRAVLPRQPL